MPQKGHDDFAGRKCLEDGVVLRLGLQATTGELALTGWISSAPLGDVLRSRFSDGMQQHSRALEADGILPGGFLLRFDEVCVEVVGVASQNASRSTQA